VAPPVGEAENGSDAVSCGGLLATD